MKTRRGVLQSGGALVFISAVLQCMLYIDALIVNQIFL